RKDGALGPAPRRSKRVQKGAGRAWTESDKPRVRCRPSYADRAKICRFELRVLHRVELRDFCNGRSKPARQEITDPGFQGLEPDSCKSLELVHNGRPFEWYRVTPEGVTGRRSVTWPPFKKIGSLAFCRDAEVSHLLCFFLGG